MVTLDRFRATYLNECAELVSDMEGRLVALDEHGGTPDELNAIFRCAHSIKGGAGAFGFSRVAAFTHKMETLLDELREGRVQPTPEVVSALLKSVDVTIDLLDCESQGKELPADFGDDLSLELLRLAGKADAAPAAAPMAETSATSVPLAQETASEPSQAMPAANHFLIHFLPHENLFQTGNDPLNLLRELGAMGSVEVRPDLSRLPPLSDYNPEHCYLGWEVHLATDRSEADVRSVFEFVEDHCDLAIASESREADLKEKTPQAPTANVTEQVAPAQPVAATVEVAPQPTPTVTAQAETVAAPTVAPQASTPAPTPVSAATAEAKAPEVKMGRRATDNPAGETHAALAVSSIRVDLDKIDRLVNMVGELVITQAMLQVQTRGLPVDQFTDLLRGVDELSQHMRELQEAVMSVRMQPVKSVFSRMPRIVRDIAQQLGKDIRLVMVGENTEVDKTIIEQLADPLTHMIRNAADHGIETPEERIAAGKNPQGTIILTAAHQGGHIVMEVSEDGAGLNHDKILAKARQKGLIAPDQSLTDEMIAHLIFLPGFSTADQVSNISGRGVGMDVVKRNIEAMGGNVQLRSTPGKGTCFTVMLPLTLAILDGMIVRVGGENYIIPIANIIETMRPSSGSVHGVPDGHDVLNVRGDFLPIVYLHELFDVKNAETDPDKYLVVLVESGAQRIGMVVDELIGQQQVVIKSLEANADPVDGISGATILGDGKVSLIIDVAGMHKIVKANELNHNFQQLREAS